MMSEEHMVEIGMKQGHIMQFKEFLRNRSQSQFDDLPEVPPNIHAKHGLQDDIQTLCGIHDDNVRNILNEMIPKSSNWQRTNLEGGRSIWTNHEEQEVRTERPCELWDSYE